jgi:F420-dependent methylenetetrahydromethanopterin dehydrogenase
LRIRAQRVAKADAAITVRRQWLDPVEIGDFFTA